MKAGLPIEKIRGYSIDDDGLELGCGTLLAPVSLTWPMGFAHSAYVAQQIMIEDCLLAGLSKKNKILSSAGSMPAHHLPCITVATDYVNAFARLSREERAELQESPLACLDEVWSEMKIIAQLEKSSDLSRSGVMLGVELVNGMQLHPKRTRLGVVFGGLTVLLTTGVDLGAASVRAVSDPLHLPYDYDDFIHRFSVRAKVRDDAPTMEAVAVTLAMRRVTRSIRHHGHRHVFLLDAQALLYALRKGRNSSRAFKVQLQKVGTLTVCAGILPYYGYIPTACNPGNPPSRGIKLTLKRFPKIYSVCGSWQQHCQSPRRPARFLKA